MVAIQLLVMALFASTQARTIYPQELEDQPFLIDVTDLAHEDFVEHLEPIHPAYLNRARRQIGSMSTNPDGSANLNLKVPIARGESNVLSVVGAASGIQPAGSNIPGPGYTAAGGGLALNNIDGHALSVTGQHVPNLGDQATAAGRFALVNTPDHKLGANAFVTKTMPSIPNLPDFNTRGASVDYLFKDKVGASLGTSYTDLFKKTDYSATGNVNLFRDPSSSLDLNAGFTKAQSPFPAFNHNWRPQGGLSFTKDKVGASLGTSYTDLFKKTDYSATGNVNLFRDPSSSLDLNAGFTKAQSPFPAFNHNWRPQGGLSFTKYF